MNLSRIMKLERKIVLASNTLIDIYHDLRDFAQELADQITRIKMMKMELEETCCVGGDEPWESDIKFFFYFYFIVTY